MAREPRARQLRLGFIALAAIAACSPIKNRIRRENGRAGSPAVSMDAGAGKPKTKPERDASAEDASAPTPDAAAKERDKSDAGGRDDVGVGTAAAGSGGTEPRSPAAGSGGSAGASGAAGMTAPVAGAPAPPGPGPLKRPTVCPASGEVQLNWRDAMMPLPRSGAEFLQLLGDGECAGTPIATTVSAKLQLINRSNMPQTAECWLSSSKASDYVQPQLAAREMINVYLEIVNPAGGAEHANASTVMCRNAGAASGELAVTGIKLITEAVTAAEAVEVK